MRPPDPIGGDVARRAAQAELRHAEYHRDDPGVVDRAARWLGHRIADLFSGSTSGNITLVFVLLLGGVLIFLAARAGSLPGRARAAAARDPLAPEPSVDHRRLAAEYEAAGRWADAMREWLRATVRTIEERGVLDPVPGRTGAATAREAGARLPAAADNLRTVTSAFDEVWFGGRPATPGDAGAAHRLCDSVARAPIARSEPADLVAPR